MGTTSVWLIVCLGFGVFAYFMIGEKVNLTFQQSAFTNIQTADYEDQPREDEDVFMYGVKVPSRTFEPWPKNLPFPCLSSEHKKRDREHPRGLYYIKVPKAASSTGAGLALRIAHRYSKRIGLNETCRVQYTHRTAEKLRVARRKKLESFLWTFIREPASHRLSAYFFFDVSRKKTPNTDENMIEYVSKFRKELPYIAPVVPVSATREMETNNATQPTALRKKEAKVLANEIQQTLNEYNFIGITERLDESLVVLRILMGMDEGDMLYMSSKVSGGYDDGKYQDKCQKIHPTIVTPAAKKLFESPEWRTDNAGDFMLYKAVNKSLDLTIENVIGRDVFDKALSRHKKLLELAHEYCVSRTFFPCSADGELQREKSNCYVTGSDWGCGFDCLDEFYEEVQNGRIKLH